MQWNNFGYPVPATFQDLSFEDGWGYSTEGDGWHQSGSWSKQFIDISNGIVIEFRVKQEAGDVWDMFNMIGFGRILSGYQRARYSFDFWLLDGESRTENPITITMDKNYTLEAYFIDDIPPELSEPWQDPPRDNVQLFQDVTVWVNVTDYGTGIKNVTLWYSLNNGTTWEEPINMTALPIPSDETITYEATIRGFENCTWVTYKIIAYDNAGNNATKDNNGYGYQYHIIPEFPSSVGLLGFLMLITIPLVFTKRKCRQKSTHKLPPTLSVNHV